MGKKRLVLELGEETYDRLEKLAQKHRKAVVDIIREGIALRELAEGSEKGKGLALIEGDKIESKIAVD